jgi:hypothetical protein
VSFDISVFSQLERATSTIRCDLHDAIRPRRRAHGHNEEIALPCGPPPTDAVARTMRREDAVVVVN